MGDEPASLQRPDDFGKVVGFALVPYFSLGYSRFSHVSFLDQVMDLLSGNGERPHVRCLEHEAAAVGIEGVY